MEILPTAGCLALAASGDYIPTKKSGFRPSRVTGRINFKKSTANIIINFKKSKNHDQGDVL